MSSKRSDAPKLSARRRGDLARELEAFFCHEPGAVQSNYAGIAALALSGVRTSAGNAFGDEVAIERMHRVHKAVGHHEAIRRAVQALSEADRSTLWLAFGPHRLAPEAKRVLEETAGAALLTDAARDACRKAAGTEGEPTREQVSAWLLGACRDGDHYALVNVIEERDELVEAALAAYAEAKGGRERRFLTPEGYGI